MAFITFCVWELLRKIPRELQEDIGINPAHHLLAFALHVDKAGLVEFFEMVRERRLGDVQVLAEVADGARGCFDGALGSRRAAAR